MIRKLTEEECLEAVKNGDFSGSPVSGAAAAVILTQSWCSQWKSMEPFLPKAEAAMGEVNICYTEYDIEKWENLKNEDFMAFKESAFNNREIPYVRYYKNGVFVRDGNYISLEGFISRLS